MNKVIVEKINSIMSQFSIGQTLWTLSWDEPKLLEFTLCRVDVSILDNEYCSITFTLEDSLHRLPDQYCQYHEYNDTFFDNKCTAEEKLKRLWSL